MEQEVRKDKRPWCCIDEQEIKTESHLAVNCAKNPGFDNLNCPKEHQIEV